MGSRYLNLPQTGEIPSSMVDQFFNDIPPPLRKKTIQELKEEEREAREKAEIAITEALLNEDLENIEDLKNGGNGEKGRKKRRSFRLPSSSGSGPLGWLGINQIILGLFLLLFDAFTNPLSQSGFGVSASLFAILSAVLSFISASRWPERISLCILLPGCAFTSLLWACLGIESSQKLSNHPIPINCPSTKQLEFLIWFKWLKEESFLNIRKCIGPAINSILLCIALIGGFLSLCSLLVCCRSLHLACSTNPSKIKKLKRKMSVNKPMIAAAHRPFTLLISPTGRVRTKIPRLPLRKIVEEENKTNETNCE